MKSIYTIDLWIPDDAHRPEIYSKAFRAGFDASRAYSNKAVATSYDKVEFYHNCNVAMSSSLLYLDYRHSAIIFYKDSRPIRLLVDNIPAAEVKKFYNYAIVQRLGANGRYSLQDVLENVAIETIDLGEEPKHCNYKHPDQIQIASCDRWDLFLQLIDNMKEDRSAYRFDSSSTLRVAATLGQWSFMIMHRGMFYNTEKQHYITLQSASPLVLA